MSPLHMFYAILVAAVWGANFVAAKYGLAHFPPFFFTALRFAAASLLLLPFVDRPTSPQMRAIVPIALLSGFHFALMFVALHRQLDISTSALVGQLGVPFTCLFGAMFLGDRLGPRRIGGIVIAFIGIAVVAGTPNIAQHPAAFMLAISSAFIWAVANIFIKRLRGIPSMQLLAWMSLISVPQLLLLSYFLEPEPWLPLLTSAPLTSLLGLTYTVCASTLLAYGLWYFLLSRHPVSQVTPFSLLTPVFGIACGELFFHETLTSSVLLGGAITILGVAIIVLRQPKHALITEAT